MGGSFLALGPHRLQPTFSLSLFLAVGPLPSLFSRAGRLLPILSRGPASQSRPPSLPLPFLGRLSSFSYAAQVAKQDQLGLFPSLSKGPSQAGLARQRARTPPHCQPGPVLSLADKATPPIGRLLPPVRKPSSASVKIPYRRRILRGFLACAPRRPPHK